MKKQIVTKIVSRLGGLALLLSLCSAMTSCAGMDFSQLNNMPRPQGANTPQYNPLAYQGANINRDYSGRAGQLSAGGGTYDTSGVGGQTSDGQYTDDVDYSEQNDDYDD